ncbi:hypothetical protein GCM10018790_63500 [Kitasatospora xanthocidica]|uniref:hypothetical protein n=1 Tax=Kitasatospora xanthocidica TaxID=83382 RepID=UPI0016754014|nr:hypothetical protein [Kitasatospora xanthocidica]GHF76720.1 hypothetical protein GCM10018790_63500 [Kitasatospora xanthocidica]
MHLDAGGERPVLVALEESRGLHGTVVQVDLVTGERACPDTWGKRRKPWSCGCPRRLPAAEKTGGGPCCSG